MQSYIVNAYPEMSGVTVCLSRIVGQWKASVELMGNGVLETSRPVTGCLNRAVGSRNVWIELSGHEMLESTCRITECSNQVVCSQNASSSCTNCLRQTVGQRGAHGNA